jgi:putative ABC transport system permease protein
MFQTEGGYSARTIFAFRAESDPRLLVPDVRRTIWSVDPNLPVYDITTINGVVSDSLVQRRFMLMLLGAFAAIALVLAAVGLYGVLSHSVAQRTREMGLRLALGATPASVHSLVLRSGLVAVGIGIAIGFAGGLIATRLLSRMLFGVSAAE